jgi:two-component system invasion response regulator UvrY
MKSQVRFSVVVIDPEPVARYGLVSLLGSHNELQVVGESESLRTGRELCGKLKPHVVVIDPAMEGGEGFVFLKDLPRWAPNARSVAFSSVEDAACVQRALAAGASGYVTRRDPLTTVIAAVSGAITGERHVGPRIAKLLLDRIATGAVDFQAGIASRLSAREWQIFRMMGEGSAPREMAGTLGVSVKTVESHQQRIKLKLEARSATELRRQAALYLASTNASDADKALAPIKPHRNGAAQSRKAARR